MSSIPQQCVQPAKHPGWPPTALETFGQREVLKMSKLAGIPMQELHQSGAARRSWLLASGQS